jgi:hypothetical protein
MVLPDARVNNRAIESASYGESSDSGDMVEWDGESPSVWRAEVEVAGKCREGIVGDKIGSHSA